MLLHVRVLIAATSLVLAGPALADGITGAGSGSTGGSITGQSNENGSSLKTGADTGGEAVPSKQNPGSAGSGDNAVLNAPRETAPGTKSSSQPSNLNGQNPQP